jgi:hypothetical protein
MKALLSPTPPRLLRVIAASFRTPFAGLWFVVLAYYAASFFFCPHSQIRLGNLPDPDDYMYLDQVIDWVRGQGWYDNIQHRINPPEGVSIPFSRLAMLPMAGLVMLFRLFGLDMRAAAVLMAEIYPLILFAAFLITMQRIAARFVPKDWAGASSYVVLVSMAINYMFQPGHVDHHGLMVWVTALALGCALRMMEEPEKLGWSVAAGAALAAGLTLALEVLPWVLLISACLGVWAAIEGRKAAKSGFVFGLAQFVASILCLLLTRIPSDFFVFDPLTYSADYVYLAGGMAVSFAAVALAGRARLPVRLAASAGVSALCGFLFLRQFPELITGPYGAMDPDLVSLVLDEANESSPLFERIPDYVTLAGHLSSTLLAMGAATWFLVRGTKPGRWSWALVWVMLFGAFGLSVFYQSRFGGVMEMMKVIPLVAFLYHGWRWVGARRANWGIKFALRLGLVLLFAPLTGIILPYVTDPASFGEAGLWFFPAGSNAAELPCDEHGLQRILNYPPGLGAQPHTIIADTWLGPELLFRTSDNVIAAPYTHFRTDAAGNLDAFRFFSTLLPEEAKSIADRHCADLVLACTTFPASYIHRPGTPVTHEFGTHFIDLLEDEEPPSWLKEVDTSGIPNFSLFNFYLYEMPPEARDFDKACQPR